MTLTLGQTAVVVVAAWVAISRVELRALQDRSNAQRPPTVVSPVGDHTPGSVALLANGLNGEALEQLRVVLSHGDPLVRTVAARVAAVAKLSSLAPAITAALEHEGDQNAAAEEVRALLFLGGADARQSVERHLLRAGAPAVRTFLEWLLRTEPEQFANKLEDLLRNLPEAEITGFGPLMAAAIAQRPAIREGILRSWLHVAPAITWRRLLEELDGELSTADVGVLLEALDTEDSNTRQETVWAIVTRLAAGRPVPTPVIDRALSGLATTGLPTASEVTWERFGRELVARKILKVRTPYRLDLIKREAARHEWDARRLKLLDEVSQEERAALRTALGGKSEESDGRIPLTARPTRLLTQPTIRTAPLPWPRFMASLLDASRCKVSNDLRAGAIRVSYRPDGRPGKAQIDLGNLSPACEPALAALARLTLADVEFPIDEGTPQLLLLPVNNDFVKCVNEGVSGLVRRLDDTESRIDTPRKTRDVKPQYPTIAYQSRVTGTVLMEATISATGCVAGLHVVRSDSLLLELAALSAVSHWQFAPARSNGQPIAVRITVSTNFNLK